LNQSKKNVLFLFYFIVLKFLRPYDPQYLNEEVRDEDDEESQARMKLRVRLIH
jgi:hypothetical protein